MASYVHRIEVQYSRDPRLPTRTERFRSLGFPLRELHLVDVYTIATAQRDFSPEELSQIGAQLSNPVVQRYSVDQPTEAEFDYAIEVGFLPGVTDNAGTTARQTIEDYFLPVRRGGGGFSLPASSAATSRLRPWRGSPPPSQTRSSTACTSGAARSTPGRGWMRSPPSSISTTCRPPEPSTSTSPTRNSLASEKRGSSTPQQGSGAGRSPSTSPSSTQSATTSGGSGGSRRTSNSSRSPRPGASMQAHDLASAMDDDVPRGLYKICIRGHHTVRGEGRDDICVPVHRQPGAIVFDDENLVTARSRRTTPPPRPGGAHRSSGEPRHHRVRPAKPHQHLRPAVDRHRTGPLPRQEPENPILLPGGFEGVVRGVDAAVTAQHPDPQGWCYSTTATCKPSFAARSA